MAIKRETKAEIFARHGIKYKDGKIYHDVFGWIPKLIVNGNEKIGKGIWHFSTLPTNQFYDIVINKKHYSVQGTCPCNCVGCYATKGNYNFKSVKKSLAIKTLLIRNDIDFVKRALLAQIEADNIEFLRLHASGDFDSKEYINMIREVAATFKKVTFWSYTKNENAENAFDGLKNINIVKSRIPHIGLNYGHCDYILATYRELKGQGKKVYICRCGIDKNQHCTNCKGCSKNEYVLFIEHSTEYKAEKDPLYNELKAIIDAQEKP